MKNKKYEEDINLLEQIADLASQKNLTDIEFKKKFKEDTEISIKISNTSKFEFQEISRKFQKFRKI